MDAVESFHLLILPSHSNCMQAYNTWLSVSPSCHVLILPTGNWISDSATLFINECVDGRCFALIGYHPVSLTILVMLRLITYVFPILYMYSMCLACTVK